MVSMPPLPKKVNRREAEVDGKVAERLCWLHKHRPWAMEVKIKGGRLKPHQQVALKQVENGTHPPQKIPDMGRQNPYDYYYLGPTPDAIVCVVDGKQVRCEVRGSSVSYNFQI